MKRVIGQYEQNTNNMSREIEELRRKLQQLGELNKVIVEFENTVLKLRQENERLNNVLRSQA